MAEEQPTEEQPIAARSFVGDGTSGWVYGFASGEELVDVTYSDVPGPWTYHVTGRMVHGRPAITSLTIAPRDADNPEAITRDTVRRAPTGTILGRVKSALREKWSNKVTDLNRQARIQSIKNGRSWPAEHFMQVAWFCIDAELSDQAPRQVIADQWGVSEVTASRWLVRARDLGYLPGYPISPSTDRFNKRDPTEATRMIEERIVEKVLREGLTGAHGSSAVPTAVGAILHRSIFGPSEEAQGMRTEIFVETLTRMTEDYPDDQIRAAAQLLFDLLAPSHEPPSQRSS